MIFEAQTVKNLFVKDTPNIQLNVRKWKISTPGGLRKKDKMVDEYSILLALVGAQGSAYISYKLKSGMI